MKRSIVSSVKTRCEYTKSTTESLSFNNTNVDVCATYKNTSRTGQDQLNVTHTGRYTSGADFGNGGTEIVKYNPTTGDAYSINGDKEALDIIDVAHPNADGTINLKNVFTYKIMALKLEM